MKEQAKQFHSHIRKNERGFIIAIEWAKKVQTGVRLKQAHNRCLFTRSLASTLRGVYFSHLSVFGDKDFREIL